MDRKVSNKRGRSTTRPKRGAKASPKKRASKAQPKNRFRTAPVLKVVKKRKALNFLDKTLIGQSVSDDKNYCVGSGSRIDDSPEDSIRLRVLNIIDEFVNRFANDKASLFHPSNGAPLVSISKLRGVYLYAFYAYLYKCGSIATVLAAGRVVERIKLPIGLAKAFQYFAPYGDLDTKSTYNYSVYPEAMTIDTGYTSVDANFTDPLSVNTPLNRYMIQGFPNPTGEFVCSATRSLFLPTSQTPLHLMVSNLTAAEIENINSLPYGGVNITSIPKFAPDASAHCWLTNQSVESPVASFNSEMAVILGCFMKQDTDGSLGQSPYSLSLPAVRTMGGTEFVNTAIGMQAAACDYSLLTFVCAKFTIGGAHTLLKHTPFTSAANSFFCTHVPVSIAKFNDYFRQVVTVSPFNAGSIPNFGTTPNLALPSDAVRSIWFHIYHSFLLALSAKILPYQLPKQLGLANCSRFLVMPSASQSVRLPAILAKIVDAVGPIVVNGKVRIPFFSGLTLNATLGNSWTSVVSTAGVWSTGGNSWYQINTAAGGNILSSNGTPLTRTAPLPVAPDTFIIENCVMTAMFSRMGKYGPSNYPLELEPGTMPTIGPSRFGQPNVMLSANDHTANATSAPTYSGVVSFSIVSTTSRIRSWICTSRKAAAYIACYSIVGTNVTTWTSPPCNISLKSQIQDLTQASQRQLTTTIGSNFNGQLAANLTSEAMKRAGGPRKGRGRRQRGTNGQTDLSKVSVDIQNEISSKMVEVATSSVIDPVIPDGCSNKTEYMTIVKDIGEAALDVGATLLERSVRLGINKLLGSTYEGQPYFASRRYASMDAIENSDENFQLSIKNLGV